MGSSPSNCSGTVPPKDAEAVSLASNASPTAFKWYSIYMLTSNCTGAAPAANDGKTVLYYTKELNIMGVVALSMFIVVMMYIIYKVMESRKQASPNPFGA